MEITQANQVDVIKAIQASPDDLEPGSTKNETDENENCSMKSGSSETSQQPAAIDREAAAEALRFRLRKVYRKRYGREGRADIEEDVIQKSYEEIQKSSRISDESDLESYLFQVVKSQYLRLVKKFPRQGEEPQDIYPARGTEDAEKRIVDRITASSPAVRRALENGSSLQTRITNKIRQMIDEENETASAPEDDTDGPDPSEADHSRDEEMKKKYNTRSISRRQVIVAIIKDFENDGLEDEKPTFYQLNKEWDRLEVRLTPYWRPELCG